MSQKPSFLVLRNAQMIFLIKNFYFHSQLSSSAGSRQQQQQQLKTHTPIWLCIGSEKCTELVN
jgi:hypothetical protein